MTDKTNDADAAGLQRRAEDDNRTGTRHERPDPPVGMDGPAADRRETIANEDLNSADDK